MSNDQLDWQLKVNDQTDDSILNIQLLSCVSVQV